MPGVSAVSSSDLTRQTDEDLSWFCGPQTTTLAPFLAKSSYIVPSVACNSLCGASEFGCLVEWPRGLLAFVACFLKSS